MTPPTSTTAPAYTARALPVAEWERVRDLPPFVQMGCLPDPIAATIIVVEDRDGQIVGSWIAVPFTHLEGVWIADAQQHTRVSQLLLTTMCDALRKDGVVVAFTMVRTPEVQAVAEHAGFEIVPATLMGLRL